MTSLLPAVLPVGLIILIGFIVGKTNSLERATLSQLALYVLSPALVIDSLYQTDLSLINSIKLLSGFALISLSLYIGAQLVNRLFKLPANLARAVTAIIMFPNNGNMGLPVATFALGAAGLERAIIYMLGSSFVMFCFGPALIRGEGLLQGFKLTFKLPLIYAILLGLSLRIFEIQLPWQLDQGIHQLGTAAIPIALILLGLQLATTSFRPGHKELILAITRLLIAPTVAYLISTLLHLEPLSQKILILQSAMPTAVSSLVIVTEFGGDQNLVARSIMTSTILSFGTLPVVLSQIM